MTTTVDRRPKCPHCGERAVFRGLEPGELGAMARFECDACQWAVLMTEAAVKHNHAGVPMPRFEGEAW